MSLMPGGLFSGPAGTLPARASTRASRSRVLASTRALTTPDGLASWHAAVAANSDFEIFAVDCSPLGEKSGQICRPYRMTAD